jgi:hypothetical protein
MGGKWGFNGMQSIEASYERLWSKPNEIDTIEKLK